MFKNIVLVVDVVVSGHGEKECTKRTRKATDQLVSNVEGLNKELLTNLMGNISYHWIVMECLYTVFVRTGRSS